MEFKPTGIVRRIDDLGRVVIPKEQRRILGVAEGDPLELFLYEDCFIFKKYNASFPVVNAIKTLCEQISDSEVLRDLDKSDRLAIEALASLLTKNLHVIEKTEGETRND